MERQGDSGLAIVVAVLVVVRLVILGKEIAKDGIDSLVSV